MRERGRKEEERRGKRGVKKEYIRAVKNGLEGEREENNKSCSISEEIWQGA